MKLLVFFVTLVLITSCWDNDSQSKYVVQQASISQINAFVENKEDSISEIDWDLYLQKSDFEQISTDSLLLVVVKSDYAIFVETVQDSDEIIISFNVTGFKRQSSKWVKTIIDTIPKIEYFDYYSTKWKFEDINGDGEKDLLIKTYHDGKQMKRYECYLQSSKRMAFIKLKWFPYIGTPEYDAGNKILNASYSRSKGIRDEIYVWRGDSLKFVKGVISGQDYQEYTDEKLSKLWLDTHDK